jgi:hypothetical protein
MTLTPDLSFQLYTQPLLSAGDFHSYMQLREAATFEFDPLEEGTAMPAPDGSGIRCVGGQTCVDDGRRYVDVAGDGLVDLYFADRDFTVRSLRGNAVLRWEYRPGSTLYAVWQQSRSQSRNHADFHLGRDAAGLLDAPAENVLILKATYWLGS